MAEQFFEADTLRSLSYRILEAAGIPTNKATLVTENLIAANLRGVDSHGIQLVLEYLPHIKAGLINLYTDGQIISKAKSIMVYDGNNGLGQWIAKISAEYAICLASENGIGMVVVRNSNHIGMLAFWAQMMIKQGQIGLVFTNTSPLVAPWQGRERRFGTNPICMAVPSSKRPSWLLDMATTTVALGKITKAMNDGNNQLPNGWALDKLGQPTTDTKEAMAGLLTPLGGYKGYGLAMMVEILCSVLSGGNMGCETGNLRDLKNPLNFSHCFIAIDVGSFMPLEQFYGRIDNLMEMMRSTTPAEDYSEVLIAGEPEERTEQIRLQKGIPISKKLLSKLIKEAEHLGVSVNDLF